MFGPVPGACFCTRSARCRAARPSRPCRRMRSGRVSITGLPSAAWAYLGPTAEPSPRPPHPVRIGVVWSGEPHLESDRIRSIPFAVYTPFLNRSPMIPLVSLQHGDHTSEERDLLGVYAIEMPNRAEFDYLDTANVMATLDLVITVNTSVAHLAAAMGKPVWLLNRATSEWLRVGRPGAHPGIRRRFQVRTRCLIGHLCLLRCTTRSSETCKPRERNWRICSGKPKAEETENA
jgi:hypothetical protein